MSASATAEFVPVVVLVGALCASVVPSPPNSALPLQD